ncbi:xanthine dehydrogenase family protein molybdopterin-binding subunit [Dyadobacter aurulentus]|uniref:xanthine dehydrogenase family protein molybdopterin-binding subunit n=1 Tax=Dyadobacter sp. UC 10 TaxID=2605428 RepID=UPI0011F0A2B4|nr:molybdopterin cofactor-binding domain-containing protein [Dyadobacter sp. UC 10]KAA0992267.1 xanthine dehydrogenase family protein molybdopterin-binding subunit [Dyadobacter sp. UC 10]
MQRRDFIRSAGVAGGLLLSFQELMAGSWEAKLVAPGTVVPGTALGDFVRIDANGDVLFQFVKHEMGQGVATAMAQILADELCADWEKVRIAFPDADMQRYQNDRNGGHDTGGSCTIIYQWDLLRTAGATVKQMLIAAAARQWNTAPEQCYAEKHYVFQKNTAKKLAFGALALSAAKLPVPAKVELKKAIDFQIIGKSKPAKLVPKIVTGELKYGMDVKVPGMLYAVIARCPVFKGKLKSFDASEAMKIAGARDVFSTQPIAGLQLNAPYMPYDIREGVAVVADSFWAARQMQAKLIIQWDEGPNGKLSSPDFEEMAWARATHRTDPTGFIGDANAVADLNHVRKTVRASYVYPQQLHSCMEPLNCTAHMGEDGCEIWIGTQAPHLIDSEIRRVFGFSQDSVKIHLCPSGGGFGRRYYPDMAVEAAFVSRQAGNVPVKMIWTREDDHQANLAHLFQHMEYQAALDKDNNLYAWYEKEIRTYTWSARYMDPKLPSMAYAIPNVRYDFEDMIQQELVHSSAWRGVDGHGRFYGECFLDEVAAELKRDPLEFRLALLNGGKDTYVGDAIPVHGSRILRVLKLAAEKAKWGEPLPPGRGKGIAVSTFGYSYCAVIADVTMHENKLTINKMTIAIDCGKVINPSGVEQQMTGGIVWSLTALLYGGLPIKNGRAVHTNFHENKLLRMNECPPMEVHFVDTDEQRPGGVGEVSSPLGVPAVLNAIFAASGKRIRKIPLEMQGIGTA